jgi:glycosyltransferase involved in cell wall biosynthesis
MFLHGENGLGMQPHRKQPMGRPQRILLVEINEDGTVGGSHQCVYDLATRLDPARFEPVVLFYQDNRFADLLRQAGVRVHVWDDERATERHRRWSGRALGLLTTAFKVAAAIVRRVRFLRHEQIDLVHLNNSPSIGFEDWLPAARLARIPILSHMRGPFYAPARGVSRWLTQRFDAIVAISHFVVESCERGGLPSERIHLIHDGIDLDHWRPPSADKSASCRAAAGMPEEAMLVVQVGLLRSWKGQDVALKALASLQPDLRARIRLWLVGEAPQDEASYADQLERFVREEGLAESVSFLGFRSDVRELIGAADVVLHASTVPEPFGLVVAEGLAMGKPVIASHGGGPEEMLQLGDGLLFDASEPLELADLLAQLADSPELRTSLGERGLERSRDFDVAKTVESVAALWGKFLGPGRSSGVA